MRGCPVAVAFAFAAASLGGGRQGHAEARCAGSDPWVLVQLRADGWSEAQRGSVLLDLQRTLAAQGIDACLGDARPGGEPLATLAIDVSPDSRATVDIEVRDAVTHKRVRRDVDLAPIPSDGRELAVAIEADELLRASWAEIALDTERARRAEPRREVVRSVDQVLAPSRMAGPGALGARLAGEYYFGGTTLLGADALGRLRLAPRLDLELAAGMRASPSSSSAHGRVRALAAGAGLGLLVRIAGTRSASVEAGGGLSASWLEFRAEPVSGADASAYANLLVAARVRVVGRVALGRALHAAAGLGAGAALRGVQATDTGQVVAGATGLELGATLGLEAP